MLINFYHPFLFFRTQLFLIFFLYSIYYQNFILRSLDFHPVRHVPISGPMFFKVKKVNMIPFAHDSDWVGSEGIWSVIFCQWRHALIITTFVEAALHSSGLKSIPWGPPLIFPAGEFAPGNHLLKQGRGLVPTKGETAVDHNDANSYIIGTIHTYCIHSTVVMFCPIDAISLDLYADRNRFLAENLGMF